VALHFRRAWLSVAAAAFFAVCCLQTYRLGVLEESGILPTEPPTPYIRYQPAADALGRVLLVHGLNSSKEFMKVLGSALADGGFEVYSIDLPASSDTRWEQACYSTSPRVGVLAK
jgi:hypothetical protein